MAKCGPSGYLKLFLSQASAVLSGDNSSLEIVLWRNVPLSMLTGHLLHVDRASPTCPTWDTLAGGLGCLLLRGFHCISVHLSCIRNRGIYMNWLVHPCFLNTHVTFGICMYSLADLLIVVLLWVCLHVSVM